MFRVLGVYNFDARLKKINWLVYKEIDLFYFASNTFTRLKVGQRTFIKMV